MSKSSKKSETLSAFQKTLLENLIRDDEVLRHGHSEPVQDLIKRGYVERVNVKGAIVFKATKEAKKALK